MVRLAQSDPTTLGSLCDLLEQLTDRLRNSQSIIVQSYDTCLPPSEENIAATPTVGTLKAAPNMYRHKRFKSRNESRRNIIAQKRSPLLSIVGRSNDLDVVQFANCVVINEDHALKSTNTKSPPSLSTKIWYPVMSWCLRCQPWVVTILSIDPQVI